MSRRRELSRPAWTEGAAPAHRLRHAMTVAFRDCDPMGVLWHGNYLAYCEVARDELGTRIGFGVARLIALRLHAPVVRSQVLHHRSLRPGEGVVVEAELWASAQPRLYHRYRLWRGDQLAADAETEQVLTTRDGALLLAAPPELAAVFR